MKKRLILVISGLILLMAGVGYSIYSISIQNGQDTALYIYQNDMNGTPIVGSSPIKLVSKAGHRNPFSSNVAGYILKSSNPLGKYIPRNNRTIHLKYKSELTKSEINKKLRQAKFINVASQQVSTTVLNNQQYEGKSKNQVVARINFSKDGINWSKLNISYPNVNMKRPSAMYRNKRLYLFDGSYVYWTRNYSKWHREKIDLNSSLFKAAQVYSQLTVSLKHNYLIVKATDQQTKKIKYYYGNLNTKKFTVNSWKELTGFTSKKFAVKNIQKLHGKYYVLAAEGKNLRVYQSSRLSSKFKLVSSFKKSGADKIHAASLSISAKGQYQLFYNERDKNDFQSTMYYRKLTNKFRPEGKKHELTTDFLWYDFQDVYNKY